MFSSMFDIELLRRDSDGRLVPATADKYCIDGPDAWVQDSARRALKAIPNATVVRILHGDKVIWQEPPDA